MWLWSVQLHYKDAARSLYARSLHDSRTVLTRIPSELKGNKLIYVSQFCLAANVCPLHARLITLTLRDYNVNMRLIYINMQHKFVEMEHNYVNLRNNYVNPPLYGWNIAVMTSNHIQSMTYVNFNLNYVTG